MGELGRAIEEHLELKRRRDGVGVPAEETPAPPASVPSRAGGRDRRGRREPSAAQRRVRRRTAAAALVACGAGLAAAVLGAGGSHDGGSRPEPRTAAQAVVDPPDPWAAAGDRALFPFPPSPFQRAPAAAEELPAFWDDGLPCSIGCRPPAAIAGWPLRPFRGRHALRAGLNERRPSGFHVGVDIQARDGQQVYAIEPGTADIVQATGADARVRVGSYVYWHLMIEVEQGQQVVPYRTVLGTVRRTAGHLHLSEVAGDGRYLNPLRPGGRVLSPWSDTLPPVVDQPTVASDGTAVVAAYDPQSTRAPTTYETPVLAPAAVAYAVWSFTGERLTPLQWAIRGSHHLPRWALESVYMPGARPPGWRCFAGRRRCVPRWRYRLAGGLAPRLTALGLPPGTYRLTAYAWDWAGNVAARDLAVTWRPDGTVARYRQPRSR